MAEDWKATFKHGGKVPNFDMKFQPELYKRFYKFPHGQPASWSKVMTYVGGGIVLAFPLLWLSTGINAMFGDPKPKSFSPEYVAATAKVDEYYNTDAVKKHRLGEPISIPEHYIATRDTPLLSMGRTPRASDA